DGRAVCGDATETWYAGSAVINGQRVGPPLGIRSITATMYLYSLQPPSNPHRSDPRIADGQKIFERERCAGCHAPPLYTNNKLTLARGFTPPPEHQRFLDIMTVSVDTDPNLALK